MTSILVVDDSEVDRLLIAGLLRHLPLDDLEIEFAAHGREGLQLVEQQAPDLVISDLMMPEMGGLELVQTLRREFPQVPVILMTAYGNEFTAVDAMEQGAASYVPKSQQAQRLGPTVQQVLARIEADRHRQRLMGCLARMECFFLLENDPRLIPPFVDFVQQTLAGVGPVDVTERVRLGVALEEALLNAICHGNLELDPQQLAEYRSELLSGQLPPLVEHRRWERPYRDRRVVVDADISTSGVRFVIRDEGPGFDLDAALGNDVSASFEAGRSRGLMLMRTIMDEVEFNDVGNQVTLVKHHRSVAPANT